MCYVFVKNFILKGIKFYQVLYPPFEYYFA